MLGDLEHSGLEEVRIVVGSGGVFDVAVDGEVVASKSLLGGLPDDDEVVAAVRGRLG